MNFSIAAGDSAQLLIPLAVDPMPGTQAVWELFAAPFANPVAPALVTKVGTDISGSSHGGVTIIESPPQLAVMLVNADTNMLLGNYTWVATLVDPAGNTTTAGVGVLTVTMSYAAILFQAMQQAPPSYDNTPFQTWMVPPVYHGAGPWWGWPIWRPPGGPPFGNPPGL